MQLSCLRPFSLVRWDVQSSSLRLSFSIQVMTSDAEIESVMFTKSVIKSSAALSYVEAQARMDDRYAILSVLNLSHGLIS